VSDTLTLAPATLAALLPEMRAWLIDTSVTADMGAATVEQMSASVDTWYPGGMDAFLRDVAQRGRAWRRRNRVSVGELVEMRAWLIGQGCDATNWSEARVLTGVLHAYDGGVVGFLASL